MRSDKQEQDFRIGCHLSASAGYLAMAKTAVEIGANPVFYPESSRRSSQTN